MDVTDILDRLPHLIAARLESDPFFDDIPILIAVKGNLAREYQARQAALTEAGGKHGVAVIVQQIAADDDYPGVPGGPLTLYPAVQVVEFVEMNNDPDTGTRKSARKIARHILDRLKIVGTFEGITQGMKAARPAIHPVTLKDQPESMVCEQVDFECTEASSQALLYCLPPVITAVPASNPPAVQLVSATPGAVIWYTLDDTYPYPGSSDDGYKGSTAIQYAGTIQVPLNTPTLISAVAYQDGYVDSSLVRQTVTITSNP